MKSYLVEINAVVWKQIEVRAESVEAADTMAHELFNLAADGCPERYDQQTQMIWELEDDRPNIRKPHDRHALSNKLITNALKRGDIK